MELKRRLSILALLLTACSFNLQAQKAVLARGDKFYEAASYARAIECYELAFRKDVSSIVHARRLADCYWNLRDTKNAEHWYAVVAASSQTTAEDVYRYAELLRISGQFANSDLWMKKYAKLAPGDSRVQRKEDAFEKLGNLLGDGGITHKVVKVGFNSDHSDMAPSIHGHTIMFASNRVDNYTSRYVDGRNDQPFLNLFTGTLADDGAVTDIKAMDGGINTEYHESNAVISEDGSELYFDRNNFLEGRKVLSDEGINNLQIFVRKRTANGWSQEVPFPYNSPAYSCAHPALSKDGMRLYFTSDRPDGFGGKDLYVCYRDDHGAWGEPRNLGNDINTEGDEMFPYIHDNVLYFASDGHLGLGGLDLFRSTIRGDHYGQVENLNAPVNSAADDFGLCLSEDGELGFFTSDRDGALGAENIYFFRMNSKAEDDRVWSGRVLDIADARPVPYLPVRLLDMDRNELARAVTSVKGVFELPAPHVPAFIVAKIPGGSQTELMSDEIKPSVFGDTDLPDMYINSVMDLPVNAIIRDAVTDEWLEGVTVTVTDTRDGTLLFHGVTNELGISQGEIPDRRFGDDVNIEVQFSRRGYLTQTVRVDFRVLMFLEQALTGSQGASLSPVTAGVDMAKAMNLNPIYFDFRDDGIRSDAARELDQVAKVMRADPSIKIDLRSHTDSRASTEYNDALSQRRAESSRNYLISQGISGSRITCKGYGERHLVNRCADGVECTEEEHQANRRTEFIIVDCETCGNMTSMPQPRR